jgi:DNA end-binding protein Ku
MAARETKARSATKRHEGARETDGDRKTPATVWKGFISFGLVSFPVRLASAARAEAVHFHMLHKKDLSRVREVWYCADEDKPIERSDIVKGFEISKNRYVVVDDEELKKIAPATATTMEIVQFVGSDEVDPIFFESSYYVAAEDKTARPYVLFMAALADTKQNAIAKIAMHNREHIVLIRPYGGGLILHTLYYPDELHKTNKSETPKAQYSAKELELAKTLVSNLSAPFKPVEFQDSYRENVERLIRQKQKGQKITPIRQPEKAPVMDLMEALKRSLKSGSQGKSTRAKKSDGRHKAA